MVGHLAWNAKDAGSSPAQRYTFSSSVKFTLREKFIYKLYISELRTSICLDDCRQSSTSAHVHHLRNEQCTCAYDLNKTRWPPDGVHACLIRSWTRQPISS